jgi:hypothetical protein
MTDIDLSALAAARDGSRPPMRDTGSWTRVTSTHGD